MSNPFDINREFETAVAQYTGAPYCVAVNSCTMALFLALRWQMENQDVYRYKGTVTIPAKTYVSVPMGIKHAGFQVAFEDLDWRGRYQLKPFEIWDSARWFTSGMFQQLSAARAGEPAFMCVSFHATKTLGLKRPHGDGDEWDIEQGGAILHNDPQADKWLRRARFDGRTEGVAPKDDTFDMLGWHCYMNPSSARLGLELLGKLPKHNPPLPNDDYPDLSTAPAFRSA